MNNKKVTLSLIVFLAVIVLVPQATFASIPPGCQANYKFSPLTGQACVNQDCAPGDLFSSVTGKSCTATATVLPIISTPNIIPPSVPNPTGSNFPCDASSASPKIYAWQTDPTDKQYWSECNDLYYFTCGAGETCSKPGANGSASA